MKYTVSIIIPAKNEAEGLGTILPKIRTLYPECELIVVDDGSTDNSKQIVEDCNATVVSHHYSKGNGASIKTGARLASGQVFIYLDGDGQHNPEEIPRLLEKIEDGYDLVVGSRQKGSQASMGRAIANSIYNLLASYMTGHKVKDLTSGFRAVNAEKFKEFLYLLPNGFSYPTTSTMAFFRAGYSVCYVPIHAADRIGRSHLSPLRDGLRFLLIIFKIGSLYSPLKLFAPISLFMALSGMSWYAYTFFSVGRFTNMSALLLTSAAMVFLMGLISEQITSLMYKKD